MVTRSEGALGGIDFSDEQRRLLAEKSRRKVVEFEFGSEERRRVTEEVHRRMLGRMPLAKRAARKAAEERKGREREEEEGARRTDGEKAKRKDNDECTANRPQEEPKEEDRGTYTFTVTCFMGNRNDDVPPLRIEFEKNATIEALQKKIAEDMGRIFRHSDFCLTMENEVLNKSWTLRRAGVRDDVQLCLRLKDDLDDQTVALKTLDAVALCIVLVIVAILLKRVMWVPL